MPGRTIATVAIFLTSLWCAIAHAHEVDLSQSTLGMQRGNLTAALRFSLQDLAGPLALDTNGDGQVDADDLENGLPAIGKFVESHMHVAADGKPVEWLARSWYVTELPPDATQSTDAASTPAVHQQITIELAAPFDGSPRELTVSADLWRDLAARHRHVVQVEWPGASDQKLLTAESPSHTFTLGKEQSLAAQVAEYMKLGIEHIFLGYDHIMFLVGLVIVGGRFASLVKIVTAFTIAHSITLALAVLGVVTPASRWVESGIALSIAYVAIENLISSAPRHRWVLAFCFGLVHGFGFAGVLTEIGLPTRGLAAALLAFNFGVEVGQLCIVAALFPLALWLSRTRFQRPVVIGVSLIVLVFAVGWFVERVGNVQFMPI